MNHPIDQQTPWQGAHHLSLVTRDEVVTIFVEGE